MLQLLHGGVAILAKRSEFLRWEELFKHSSSLSSRGFEEFLLYCLGRGAPGRSAHQLRLSPLLPFLLSFFQTSGKLWMSLSSYSTCADGHIPGAQPCHPADLS